jgi:hypothetical protein
MKKQRLNLNRVPNRNHWQLPIKITIKIWTRLANCDWTIPGFRRSLQNHEAEPQPFPLEMP